MTLARATYPVTTRHLKPEDLRGRRWRGLIRESTEAQADKWSPERQRKDLLRAAEELGLIPVEPAFYERTGSGETVGAVEVSQALSEARSGQFDVLLVLHTSRLARNKAEAYRIKQEAQSIGLVIYFVEQRIISGSRSGRLLEGISEVIDEEANQDRRMWIAGGLRERQLSGHWSGRLPTGYRQRMREFEDRTVRPDGGLEPDPVMAPIVQRIFRERIAGFGGRVISRRLNGEGLRNAGGKPWEHRHVTDILSNPAYKGTLQRYRRDSEFYYPLDDPRDGRQEITGDWEPLVSVDDWAKAQALISHQKTVVRGSVRSYPLSGFLRCHLCRRKMSGMGNASGKRYYRCPGRSEHGLCPAAYLRADSAEAAFGDYLSDHRPPERWEADRLETKVAAAQKILAQAEKERITGRMARLREMYEMGDIKPADYKAHAAELREALSAATPRNWSQEKVAAFESAADRWDKDRDDPIQDAINKRAVAIEIVESMTLGPDGFRVEWRDEWRDVFGVLRVSDDGLVKEGAMPYTNSA